MMYLHTYTQTHT